MPVVTTAYAPLFSALLAVVVAGGCFQTVPTSDPQIRRPLVIDQGSYYGIGPQLVLRAIFGDFMGYSIVLGNSLNVAPGAPPIMISPAIQLPAAPGDYTYGDQPPAGMDMLGLISKQYWEGLYIADWLYETSPNLSDWRTYLNPGTIKMFSRNPPSFPGANLSAVGAFMWDDSSSWYYYDDYRTLFSRLGIDVTILDYKTSATWVSDIVSMETGRAPALFWWSPQDYHFPDLNATRVRLPPFDPNTYLDYGTGTISGLCDFPVYRFAKYVAPDLNVTSPWAYTVMTRFDFTDDDYMWMQSSEGQQIVSDQSTACQWARANEHRWKQWIPTEFFLSEVCAAGRENIGRFADALNRTFCNDCPAGRFSANGTGRCQPCPVGTYADGRGLSSCALCPYLSTTLAPGATSVSECQCASGSYEHLRSHSELVCIACDESGYTSGPGQLRCTPCQAHAATNTTGATSAGACGCITRFFEVRNGSCQPCPGGANCAGRQATPSAQVGFWSSTDAPLDFYLCSSPERCPGALAPGECPDGYEGALCARCRPGWYTDGILCRECRRSAWEVVLTGAFFLLIAIPCVVIFLMIDMAKNRQNEHSSVSWTVAAKQTIEFCQVLSVVGRQILRDSNVVVPNSISIFASTAAIFSLSPDKFRVGCLLQVTWGLSYTVRCAVLNIFSALVATATLTKQFTRNTVFSSKLNRVLSASLRLVDLLYIYHLSSLVEVFICYEQPNVPGFYSSWYTASIRCYAPGEWSSMLPLTVAGLFLTTLVYPVMVGVVMWSAPSQTYNDGFFETFAHYFRPFQNKMWFWYCPMLLWKLSLSILLSSVGPGDSSTMAIAVMIICIYLVCCVKYRPYFHNANNRLDLILGTSLLSIIVLLLAMQSVPAGNAASIQLVSSLTLIVLVASLLFALWTILVELSRNLDPWRYPTLYTIVSGMTFGSYWTQNTAPASTALSQTARANNLKLLSDAHVRQWAQLASDDEIQALNDTVESLAAACSSSSVSESTSHQASVESPGQLARPSKQMRIQRPTYAARA
ncbi:Tyrosine-protein kinase ephrin type A/B receptor-like domain-containing protein [Plasmodiophora brassicae]